MGRGKERGGGTQDAVFPGQDTTNSYKAIVLLPL